MERKLLYENMRLLIVEDLEEYTESIAFMAEDYFDQLSTASNLVEAKKAFGEEVPEVAIIDIRLSEEDENNKEGVELLKWIRENAFKTKVVMISAYRDFDYAVEALNAGAEYFLRKPVKNAELEKIIKKLVDSNGSLIESR